MHYGYYFFFIQWLFQPIHGLASFSVPWSFLTDGRTPWTSDQSVVRPLPKHRTTQTQNKRIHKPNIHALYGIGTHDPSVRASEDSSCLRSRGQCDRPTAAGSNENSPTHLQLEAVN
jgi:hypothetical protein